MARLAHELRNPLAVISNGIELLRVAELPADRRADTVAMMERQVDQIRHLLDRLVDAARVVSGELEIERERVELAHVCRQAAASIAQSLEHNRQELAVTLPADGEIRVRGDAARLVEAVSHLLTNAVAYTGPGGKIDLELTAESGSATLRVRDTGIGLPEELGPRIFDAFTRGARRLDGAGRGLGLGLPLVRALVELHGGTVKAYSEGDGRGSEFRVDLPMLDTEDDAGLAPREGGGPRTSRNSGNC